MNNLLIHNARVIGPGSIKHGGVVARRGRIARAFDEREKPTGFSASESLDLRGAFLSPGFLDIHIHGSSGIDVQETDADGLGAISRFLLVEGVTGYFATFVPADTRDYQSSIAQVGSY